MYSSAEVNGLRSVDRYQMPSWASLVNRMRLHSMII